MMATAAGSLIQLAAFDVKFLYNSRSTESDAARKGLTETPSL